MAYHTFSRYLCLLPMKLGIQLSDLRDMTLYHANESEAFLLFSRLVIVASLSIVCTYKKIVTQSPNVAQMY